MDDKTRQKFNNLGNEQVKKTFLKKVTNISPPMPEAVKREIEQDAHVFGEGVAVFNGIEWRRIDPRNFSYIESLEEEDEQARGDRQMREDGEVSEG